MKREKSAGAIIFRLERGKPRYLLLHYPSSAKAKREYWDLPKGHIEEGEKEKDTVVREIKEETGLRDITLFKGFRETIHYWFQLNGHKVSKTVVFYLARTRQKHVAISEEHLGLVWLGHTEAQKKLTYKNAKQVLQKAHEFFSTRKRAQ